MQTPGARRPPGGTLAAGLATATLLAGLVGAAGAGALAADSEGPAAELEELALLQGPPGLGGASARPLGPATPAGAGALSRPSARRRRRAMTVDWAGAAVGPSPLLERLERMGVAPPLGGQEPTPASGPPLQQQSIREEEKVRGEARDTAAAKEVPALPPTLFEVGFTVAGPGATPAPTPLSPSTAPASPGPAGLGTAGADEPAVEPPLADPGASSWGAAGAVSAEGVPRAADEAFGRPAGGAAWADSSDVMADGVPAELGEVLSNATATFGGKVAELVRQTANATVEVNLASMAAAPQPGKETPVVVVQLSKVKVVGLLVALTVVGSVLAAAVTLLRGPASGDGELQRRVEGLRVTGGAELRSMFGLSSGCPPPEQALSPGILMRIRGRVVAGAEGPQRAPFSGRACAVYSASVSRGRHDGIQPPPLAFHSAGRDFEVQLVDAPCISVAVHSHDVSLFSMAGGLQVHELPFAGAPESWRRFVLDRLVPVACPTAHFKSCEDMGSAGGPLQFRECCLPVGGEATLVGELAREPGGALRLRPWRPPSSPKGRAAAGPLCGHVMASDSPSLLGGAPAAPRLPPSLQRRARCAPQVPWPWPDLRSLLRASARPKPAVTGGFPVPGALRPG